MHNSHKQWTRWWCSYSWHYNAYVYNLIEYSDNYSDTSGSLRQFKRDESPVTIAGNTGDTQYLNTNQVFLNP